MKKNSSFKEKNVTKKTRKASSFKNMTSKFRNFKLNNTINKLEKTFSIKINAVIKNKSINQFKSVTQNRTTQKNSFFNDNVSSKNKNISKLEIQKRRNRINSFTTLNLSIRNNQLSIFAFVESRSQIDTSFAILSETAFSSIMNVTSMISTESIISSFDARFFVDCSKNENVVVKKLNLWVRRYYMITLSNDMIDELVRRVFFEMMSSHKTYKLLLFRVRSNFKSWKFAVIKTAKKWDQRWRNTTRDERIMMLTNFTTHKQLKRQLMREFNKTWLKDVFRFALFVIDIEALSNETLMFSRCQYFDVVLLLSLTDMCKCLLPTRDIETSSWASWRRYLWFTICQICAKIHHRHVWCLSQKSRIRESKRWDVFRESQFSILTKTSQRKWH